MRYHKVQGSENNAGVFTKELDHDGVVRHTEVWEVSFRFGRDPFALTVNNMSARVNMEKCAQGDGTKFKTMGGWTRGHDTDLNRRTYDITNKVKTVRENVAYRVSADALSGTIISTVDEEH